jgi:hypothetical protein
LTAEVRVLQKGCSIGGSVLVGEHGEHVQIPAVQYRVCNSVVNIMQADGTVTARVRVEHLSDDERDELSKLRAHDDTEVTF